MKKAFLVTLIFPLALCVMFGAVALSIVEAPRGRPNDRAVGKVSLLPRHTEWTVGKEIRYQEEKCSLPRGSIAALIEHETGGTWDEKSYNPERKSSCYRNAKSAKERERCASRGLTQTVARWHLPKSASSAVLDNPIVAIRVGANKLCQEYRRSKGDLRKAYARYNGVGQSAEVYAANVMNEYKYFRRML